MEFEEFAKQFRQRTTQRMMEFEKALAQAQERVEKSVSAPGSAPTRASQHQTPPTQHQTPHPPHPAQSRRGAARGQVQGLLRKQ